ncbi:MAG TPA: enolase C-terminal domain-like protein, partial [Thermohalobaculum sp.]|nr:enolase C-terminal domain-like protein [Thermohalobaculum sp.]
GLDIALHDLFARRAGVPLARLLDPSAAETVAAYASGIHVAAAPRAIGEARAAGHRAFKVKVGFGRDEDVAMLGRAADACRDGEPLLADANQAWDADEALAFLARVAEIGLGWLEEPIAADAPEACWARLTRASTVPLAGGENIAGLPAFEAAIAAGSLSVLQPDVAKWGGVTGGGAVARRAIEAGRRYCPHFLGGGIGLAASAHLLAAAGGDGLLEMDVNPNPLRDSFAVVRARVADGRFRLADTPGLGVEELPEEIGRFRTMSLSRHL